MAANAYRAYPLVALTLLAGATVWLERVSRPPETQDVVRTARDPNFITEGARMVRHGLDGSVRHVLLADKMIHFPETGESELVTPLLTINGPDGGVTEIRAERGRVSENNSRVDLAGNVRVLRPAQGGKPESRYSSASLTVWPDAQRARSNDPVTVEQGDTRVRARGLDADNLFGNLKLNGEVRAKLPPSRGKRP